MQEKLYKLLDNSYSPYSHFKVAAIVVMKDGTEFNGVNVENESYGATICAERNAIFSAISAGYKKGDFDRLYVMTDSKEIGMCCFACRQVIIEFFSSDSIVTNFSSDGKMVSHTVLELCPYPFNMDDKGAA